MREREIAVDTENRDPNLKSRGPGHIRGDGHVAGVGISTDTGFTGYFPIGHAGGGNLDKEIVCEWLRKTLAVPDRDYIFANAQYDKGWLRTLGVEIGGRHHDICIADTMMDQENFDGYSLEALGIRWLGIGKDEAKLHEAATNWGVDAKAELWKLPASLVGKYAETDPLRTLQIWAKQKLELKRQELWDTYLVESDLTPVLFEMFWRGIRVNVLYAEELNHRWQIEEAQLRRDLGNLDIWSSEDIGRMCEKNRISVPRTKGTKKKPNGSPSITKGFLEASKNPILQKLLKVRAINRVRSTYLEGNLIKSVGRDGRIHPRYIQMATDEGGTRTFRLACVDPNAQQFPKRSRLFDAKSLRKCLIPEDGCFWDKKDYWSQEPVIQNHYALLMNLPGAEAVRQQFVYGVKLAEYVEKATGGRLNYDQAKQVILARTYNQQAKGMSITTGMSYDECVALQNGFDELVPYIKILNDSTSSKAEERGWIRLLLGHKAHFHLYEVPKNLRPNDDDNYSPLPLAKAKERWPELPLKRAGTYKAFNRLCQGGAAGQTKKALVEIAKNVGLPQMTVHDEISNSNNSDKQSSLMEEIMVNCIKLKSPVRVDSDRGTTWC